MTKISLIEGPGDRYEIAASGHATGSVECCAAISALMYTLKGYVINEPGGIHLLECSEGDGQIRMVFSGGETAMIVFDVIVVGLLQLAGSYPQYISAEITEI